MADVANKAVPSAVDSRRGDLCAVTVFYAGRETSHAFTPTDTRRKTVDMPKNMKADFSSGSDEATVAAGWEARTDARELTTCTPLIATATAA